MELKKNPKLDFRKYSVLFFNIGLVLSLASVISAFEWKFEESISEVDILPGEIPEEQLLVPITEQKPPEPKLVAHNLVEIADEKIILEPDDIKFDIHINEDEPVIDYDIGEMPDEKPEETFVIVEDMPSFNDGGKAAFLKYVMSKIKYPNQARRIGLEGKVFVQFVINKQGKMTEIEVVRGIGGGCDKEVLRVLNEAPAWSPGKQRGVPVRVRMILPVTFTLN
jgi:protein TonB